MSARRPHSQRRPTAGARPGGPSAPFVPPKMDHLVPPPAPGAGAGGRRFSGMHFSLKSSSSTSFATVQRSEAPPPRDEGPGSDSDQYDTDLEGELEEGEGEGRVREGWAREGMGEKGGGERKRSLDVQAAAEEMTRDPAALQSASAALIADADPGPVLPDPGPAALERVDCGELAYRAACDLLRVVPAGRILAGLCKAELRLAHRGLGPAGCKALAAALVHNAAVTSLDLEDNELEAEGALYVVDMLRENSCITSINLSKNNMRRVGALAIGALLQGPDCDLLHLDISDNHFRDCDAEALALGIEKNEKVITLNLSHNQFSEEGAIALGRAIGTNNAVEKLDLSWTEMRQKGAVMICAGLKRNYCVTVANLAWNGFAHEGAVALCEMLRGNKYLRELDVTHNRINWAGAAMIGKGLRENDTLEVLHVGDNPLTTTGVLDILDSIDGPSSVLGYLGLKGVPVNAKILYAVENINKLRTMTVVHGELLTSDDVIGRRTVVRCDPYKLLVEFLSDKSIRIADLFRPFDKSKQFRVTREQFIQGMKTIKVPLDEFEIEKLLLRLEPSDDGKVNYQKLMRSVKEQTRLNRADERQPRPSASGSGGGAQRPADEGDDDPLHCAPDDPSQPRELSFRRVARNTATLGRLGRGGAARRSTRVSFLGSSRGTPSPPPAGERPASAETSTDTTSVATTGWGGRRSGSGGGEGGRRGRRATIAASLSSSVCSKKKSRASMSDVSSISEEMRTVREAP